MEIKTQEISIDAIDTWSRILGIGFVNLRIYLLSHRSKEFDEWASGLIEIQSRECSFQLISVNPDVIAKSNQSTLLIVLEYRFNFQLIYEDYDSSLEQQALTFSNQILMVTILLDYFGDLLQKETKLNRNLGVENPIGGFAFLCLHHLFQIGLNGFCQDFFQIDVSHDFDSIDRSGLVEQIRGDDVVVVIRQIGHRDQILEIHCLVVLSPEQPP